MAAESLLEKKFEASRQIADALVRSGAPLLAAFWEFDEDVDRWTFFIVPTSPSEYRRLIKLATELLVQPPYRSIFSVSDSAIDSQQIGRARALAAHIRNEPYIGRRIDMTIADGEFFESVIPVHFRPELMTHLRPAA